MSALTVFSRTTPQPCKESDALHASALTPREDEAQAVTAQRDFITEYADWADVFEVPKAVHRWIACTLIAAILNSNGVTLDWTYTVPMDLWVLLLSGSGQGRNTITSTALKIVEAAGLDRALIKKAAWGSPQALQQELAENPCGMYEWPEFSIVLQTLNNPNFAGMKEWLTDLYDNTRIPPPVTYRKTGKSSDTPSITFNAPPRINILATSSESWFINSLKEADTKGGFIPRWLPVRVGRNVRVLPKPLPLDLNQVSALGDRLRAIASLKGEACLSASADQMYREWYHEAHKKFTSHNSPELAEAFFNRLRVMVLKLAIVFEASTSLSLTVSDNAMQRAIAAGWETQETIFILLNTGMSLEGSELNRVLERVAKSGDEGILHSALTEAFKNWKKLDRQNRISTLLETGGIRRFRRSGTGRPGVFYVAREHSEAYQRRFPKDSQDTQQ